MKAAPFSYVRPATLDGVVAELVAADGEGKVLAGGQSLAPILAMRLARPRTLIDINAVAGLDSLEVRGGSCASAPRCGSATSSTARSPPPSRPSAWRCRSWVTASCAAGARYAGAWPMPIRRPNCQPSPAAWTRSSISPGPVAAAGCRPMAFS